MATAYSKARFSTQSSATFKTRTSLGILVMEAKKAVFACSEASAVGTYPRHRLSLLREW